MYHAAMKTKIDPLSPDTELAFAMLAAAARIEKRLDRVLSGIRGVSYSEYQLLRQLHLQPGATATRVDLAELVGLTASAVTRALKPLEKIGFVTTHKSERDARLSLATLTDAGLELVRDAQSVVNEQIGAMNWPAGDRSKLLAMLERLHRA